MYKCLNNTGPCYFSDLLHRNRQRDDLRTGDELVTPHVKHKTFANWSFSVAALKLWNRLPNSIRDCLNVDDFKKSPKTYLFDVYFNESDWLWH